MRHLTVRSVALLVFTILQVSVQAFQPEIEQPPTDEATVFGETTHITCRAIGDPKPKVKWIKNGRELTGRRYNTLASGDLEIENVNFLDTGNYTCVASNEFGSVEASGNLVIREQTRIIEKPEDYEIAVGSTVTFRCNAITDPSLSLTIDWLSNGEPIDFELEPRFVQLTDYSLIIMNTTELDSGTYTCVARTELDETKAGATLIVQDVPNPPHITSISCINNGATIEWSQLGDNRAPILGYKIQFNTSFTPDTWENALEILPTEQQYHVHMRPWANYTFRILARNKIGLSLPSSHSEVCTSHPDVPFNNPDDVEGKGTDPQNIVISWTVMPQIEHNAPGFIYRVFYKRDIPGEEWNFQDINDWKQHKLQVDNQPTYQRYKIKVVAINERGESRVSPDEVTGYSGEDVPLQAPTNFTLVKIMKSTRAWLSWNPVPDESIRGNFKGYKIQTWTDKDGEEGMREVVVQGNTTQARVSKFIPHSRNYVRVLAYNGRYNGPASETLTFETPEGVPGHVHSLDAFPMGSEALYLVWKKPRKPNGILTGYTIYYQVVEHSNVGPLLKREPSLSDPEWTKAKLAGLKPNTKYRIHVHALTRVGEGKEYFIERTTRTAPSVIPEVPNFMWRTIPTDSETTTIRVTWLPSRNGNPGSHFFVKYKLKGEAISQGSLPQFNEDSIEVRGLTRGEVYVLSIVAVDGEYQTESLPQEYDPNRGNI